MIKITRPANLNGAELLEELAAAKIVVSGIPTMDGNGELWIDIKEADAAKAEAVAVKHNGTIAPAQLSIDEKLASVGLSIGDLKTALGL